MQTEYQTLNKFYRLFPEHKKGIELVCQTTLLVDNQLYRDYLLDIEPQHHALIENFLFEVTRGHVLSNDVNWFNRFKGLKGKQLTEVKPVYKKQLIDKFKKSELVKQVLKPVKLVSSDDDIDDKLDDDSEEMVL
jgi:hypothetical protein